MIDENAIRARYAAIKDRLDERGRRLFVAAEKVAAGYGGTAAVSRATGVARSTIIRGAKDLLAASPSAGSGAAQGCRPAGASKADPTVLEDLRRLVEPATMGDPDAPAAVGVEKPREAGGGSARDEPRRQCQHGWQDADHPGLFSSGQSQDEGGQSTTPTVTGNSSISTTRSWRFRRPASR